MATHSTEIISECDADEIVLISKNSARSRRLRSPTQLGSVFSLLGSSANPVLTQLAKTRRVIFVEGTDFRLIGQFARKLGYKRVATRGDFAVVPTEGFNPDRVKSLQTGMEHPLGRSVLSGAILDRDFRSDEECEEITKSLMEKCDFVVIHKRKELENFVLVPAAIDRAVASKVEDRRMRGARIPRYDPCAEAIIYEFADDRKAYLISQFSDRYRAFRRASGDRRHDATLMQEAIQNFDIRWADMDERIRMIPGKDALSFVNEALQRRFKVGVTPAAIVEAMHVNEVPAGMESLISAIANFSTKAPPG